MLYVEQEVSTDHGSIMLYYDIDPIAEWAELDTADDLHIRDHMTWIGFYSKEEKHRAALKKLSGRESGMHVVYLYWRDTFWVHDPENGVDDFVEHECLDIEPLKDHVSWNHASCYANEGIKKAEWWNNLSSKQKEFTRSIKRAQ